MMAPPRAHIVRSHSGPGTNTMIAMTNGAIWTSARTMWRSHQVRQVVSWSTHGARRAGSPPPKAYQSHCRGFGRRTGTSTSSLALFLGARMVCTPVLWTPHEPRRRGMDDTAREDTALEAIAPLALETQVGFALAVAARTVISVYKPLLEPLNLTHPQYLVMLALWQEAPLSVTELG